MEERRYQDLAASTFRKVLDLFDPIDADDVDVEPSGDVIRLTYRNGAKVVLNTQRPARQLWLAGGQRAWHFDYDEAQASWRDDKTSEELFSTLDKLTFDAVGIHLR